MQLLDIALTAVIGLYAVIGLRRGFARGVLDILIWGAAILAGTAWRDNLSTLAENFGAGRFGPAIAFVILVFAILSLGKLALQMLFAPLFAAPWPPPLRWLNSVLGLVPGLAKGLIVSMVGLLVIWNVRDPLQLTDAFNKSRLAMPLYDVASMLVQRGVTRFGTDLRDFSLLDDLDLTGTPWDATGTSPLDLVGPVK